MNNLIIKFSILLMFLVFFVVCGDDGDIGF